METPIDASLLEEAGDVSAWDEWLRAGWGKLTVENVLLSAALLLACLKAIARTPNILAEPAPQVVLTGYGESAIEYHVRFWTKTEDYWEAHFAALEEIRRCFREDGVTMTYNHLNVHIIEK